MGLVKRRITVPSLTVTRTDLLHPHGERVHLNHAGVGLETHILDVVGVLAFEDLTGVILVGHSYGGNVITGVADRLPERLAHLVYLDANVPEDGQALVDLMPPPHGALYPGRSVERGEAWRRGWLLQPERTPDLPAAEAPAAEADFADLLARGVATEVDVRPVLRDAVPHPAKTYLDSRALAGSGGAGLPAPSSTARASAAGTPSPPSRRERKSSRAGATGRSRPSTTPKSTRHAR